MQRNVKVNGSIAGHTMIAVDNCRQWGLKGDPLSANCLFNFLSAGIKVKTNLERESETCIVIMLHFLWFQILTFELFQSGYDTDRLHFLQ